VFDRDKKLKAAIIGCGNIAGIYDMRAEDKSAIRTHAMAYLNNPSTELIAVADHDEERAKAFCRQWHIDRFYTAAEEMIRCEQPNIVSICTPDYTHAELLRKCLNGRELKAVWCEKPLTTDLKEAEKLVEQYEQKQVKLIVTYQRRWASHSKDLKKKIENNSLGNIQKVVAYYNKGLFNNGSHTIDLLQYWFGVPEQIMVFDCQSDYREDDPTVDSKMMFDGVPVHMLGTDSSWFSIFEIDILGTLGRARFTNSQIEWFESKSHQDFHDYKDLVPCGRTRNRTSATPMAQILENIVKAVHTKIPILSDGKSALETLITCNRILEKNRKRNG